MEKRYLDFNAYLRNIFGCRVQKISLDAGLSCPNRDGTLSKEGCIYCNSKGSGTGAHTRGISISEQLEIGKNMLSRRYKAERFIAYFQSFTNTYATVKNLKALYEEALAIKDVVGLSIGTRPDCISEPVLNLLQAYAEKYLVWIEYGLQSVHDRSLLLINRGHDFHSFETAVAATRNRGIKICAHVILGLPQEEKKHMIETAKTIAAMEIDGVKLHLLYVVKGTRLEKIYARGEYRCLSQQEYVDLVCDFLEHLPGDMVIQRLTGDPHPDELAAPMWSLDKNRTLALIQERLKKRNTWQGRLASK
jgi:radical SAM protein (TIGR01212 family)